MYKLTSDASTVLRASDGICIPARDDKNNDCAEYLQWLSKGNTPEPYAEPPPPIPTEVLMYQARKALLTFNPGLIASIDAAIGSLAEPQRSLAKVEWEYSPTVKRYNGFVELLAPFLGLDDSQLDQLFVLAAGL